MKTEINLIAACAEKNRVIGINGDIHWKIKGEQKRFKEITTGHIVVMGRKTYESIGKPLPNRINIVLTKNKNYEINKYGCLVLNSINEFLRIFGSIGEIGVKIFIIGGEQIYREFIPYCSHATISYVDGDFEGDSYLPDFESDFEVSEEERIESNIGYTVKKMTRRGI